MKKKQTNIKKEIRYDTQEERIMIPNPTDDGEKIYIPHPLNLYLGRKKNSRSHKKDK
jgi:hypothetical protein